MVSASENDQTPLLDLENPTKPVSWIKRISTYWWNCAALCLISIPSCLFVANFTVDILEDDLPVTELLFLRSFPVLLFILTFQKLQTGSLDFGRNEKFGFVVAHTIAGVLTNVFCFAAISLIPLADALTIIYGNIAVTAFLSWSLKFENLRWYGIFGVLMCLSGMAFVVQPTFLFPDSSEKVEDRKLGLLFAVLSCLFSTTVILMKKIIGTSHRPDSLTFYSCLAMIPLSLTCLFLGYPEKPIYSIKLWHYAVILAHSLGGLFGSIMVNRTVILLSGTLAAIASSFQLIIAHFTDVFIRNEDFSLYVLIGSMLMIAGSATTVLAKHTSSS